VDGPDSSRSSSTVPRLSNVSLEHFLLWVRACEATDALLRQLDDARMLLRIPSSTSDSGRSEGPLPTAGATVSGATVAATQMIQQRTRAHLVERDRASRVLEPLARTAKHDEIHLPEARRDSLRLLEVLQSLFVRCLQQQQRQHQQHPPLLQHQQHPPLLQQLQQHRRSATLSLLRPARHPSGTSCSGKHRAALQPCQVHEPSGRV
jgi:hypothetical protein